MTQQKKLWRIVSVLALILVFSMALTACDKKETPGNTDPSQPSGSSPDGKTFRVALVLPGTINDEGWNATAHRGLMKIKDELGFDVSFSEMVPVSDFTQVYRGYADEGYDLIIGHGFEFMDPARQIHEEYPNTFFAVTSTNEFTPPNICAVDSNTTHAGFINGVLAAKMTKSKIVGGIGGSQIPGITGYIYGFEEGVKYVDPSIKVLTTYTGNNEDVTAVKEVANSMINEGADIIVQSANQAGVGAFQAVNETNKEVYILGIFSDQSVLSPDKTLVSAIVDLPEAIKVTAQMCADGTLESKAYMFGIREGAVYRTEFHELVPKDVAELVDDVIAKFKSGEMDLVNPDH